MDEYKKSPYIQSDEVLTEEYIDTNPYVPDKISKNGDDSPTYIYIGLAILVIIIILVYYFYASYAEKYIPGAEIDDPAHDKYLETQINKLQKMQKDNIG